MSSICNVVSQTQEVVYLMAWKCWAGAKILLHVSGRMNSSLCFPGTHNIYYVTLCILLYLLFPHQAIVGSNSDCDKIWNLRLWSPVIPFLFLTLYCLDDSYLSAVTFIEQHPSFQIVLLLVKIILNSFLSSSTLAVLPVIWKFNKNVLCSINQITNRNFNGTRPWLDPCRIPVNTFRHFFSKPSLATLRMAFQPEIVI